MKLVKKLMKKFWILSKIILKNFLKKNLVFVNKFLSISKKTCFKFLGKFSKNFDNENVLIQSKLFVRSIIWVLLSFSSFLIIWITSAKTDEIITVKGKLEPIGEVKEINLPSGGVISQIFVKNGDSVKKGDVLIKLNQEVSDANFNSYKTQLQEKIYQLNLKNLEKDNLSKLSLKDNEFLKSQINYEKGLFEKFNFLYKNGAVSEVQVLSQSNKLKELENKLLKSDIQSRQNQIIIDQEISELQSLISKLKASVRESKFVSDFKSLKAPVDGTIFNLKPLNEGFVTKASEIILKIVPPAKIEADIEIPSSKIGLLKEGMEVDINIDSFPASSFGVIKGKLKNIASDALPPDPNIGRLEYIYPASVMLKNQFLKLNDGSQLKLQVGMSLKANIKLREVTYLQLLFDRFEIKKDSLRRI